MRRIPLAAAVAAAAVLVHAAVSQASTLSYEGGALVYRADQGVDMLITTYQPYGADTTYLAFGGYGGAVPTSQTGLCHADTSGYGATLCELDTSRPVKVYGSPSKDRLQVYFSDVPTSLNIEMHGGAGDDELKDSSGDAASRSLYGDAGNDTLLGYGGNDVLDGGDGNDEVDGGEGADQVHGGAGDDLMWGDHYESPSADLIDGGPGTDTTQDWSDPELLDRQPSIDVTLDGVANDGRPGEGDNVVSVEKLQMYVVGRLVGTDVAEELNIVNPGNTGPSTLIGNGGDDTLYGYDFDDTVDGGAGNDHVEGGLGNDTVTGGPGRDVIYGDATASRCTYYSCKVPFGNDVINARDGEPDTIDCGIGTDKAIVDAVDTVASCEEVDGSGGGGHGGGGGGGGAAFAIAVAKGKLRTLAARGLRIGVPCPAACSITATLSLKGRKVGAGRGSAKKAGTARATVRLTRAGKSKVRRLRRATFTLRVTMKPAGGAATTATKRVKMRR